MNAHLYLLPIITLLPQINTQEPLEPIECYSCASTFPSDTEQSARLAVKYLVNTRYNLPPVHDYCLKTKDPFFETIPTVRCNSRCTVLTVRKNDVRFLMRGCRDTLFKSKVEVNESPCDEESSPSICYCSKDKCNAAVQLNYAHWLLLCLWATMIGGFVA